MMAGQSVPPAEEKIVRLDGAVTDVEVNSTRLDEGADEVIQVVVRDISERKRAEAVLRQSEERLTLAFAGAQEGVWDWNLETSAVVYSPRWKQMLGYGESEIEPHVSAWERLLHPDDKPRASQLNESLAQRRATYEGEFRLRHKDGHYIHVLSRGFPVRREPGGPVVRIVGTHLDITEQKRTEAALRDSQERLTLAFAGAQEGVWDWNIETNAVVYSARWKQMLGLCRGRNRAAHQRVGAPCSSRTTGRAPTRPTTASRAASRPTRPSSVFGTRTAATSTSCRAAFRSGASRAARWCASSAPTST